MILILFVDCDGILIEELVDFQIDVYEKLCFVCDVILVMFKLCDVGYQFVIVSNQDGLGSEDYFQVSFDGFNDLMLQIFVSQGIVFCDVFIDGIWLYDNVLMCKFGIGLMLFYLQDCSIDWVCLVMVGDCFIDIQFVQNMNICGFQLCIVQFGGEWDWNGIVYELVDVLCWVIVQCIIREICICVEVDLDCVVELQIYIGLLFFDYMLEQIGKYGGFVLIVYVEGDLYIDEYYIIEDIGLVLGQVLCEVLGDKCGIGCYGFILLMDEILVSVVLDFSGWLYFVFEGDFKCECVGDMFIELVFYFFCLLCDVVGFNFNFCV